MANHLDIVCPPIFRQKCREVLRSTASFPADVVRTAYKWVSRKPESAPLKVREYLGAALGLAGDRMLGGLSRRVEDFGEQLVQNDRVDRLVREWVLGSSNADDYAEVGWALRLRDRFGFPSASEAARLAGVRWVLKQLQEDEVEEGCRVIDGFCGKPAYAPGVADEIAEMAATLWLTATAKDKAVRRHQGFRHSQ
ncbi:putative protein 1 [Johnsongrass umbra-like virus 1]|nr:putative protein 1 [Johnsongrass umbra-like virus 1]